MNYTGQCLCGAISYEVHGNFKSARSCHCSKCRKAFGGAGSAMALIDHQDFNWTTGEDNLALYEAMPSLGIYFCRTCASKLAALFDGKIAGITLGSLNEDPNIKLDEHIFVGSKASWDDIGGDVPQFNERRPDHE